LSKDKQDSLDSFLSDLSALSEFYIGHETFKSLLSIEGPFEEKFLEMKSIAVLPSSKGFLQKITGWFGKSNFLLESYNKDLFSPGFVTVRHFFGGTLDIYSEFCDKILSLDEPEDSFEFLISEKLYSCSYLLTPKRKVAVAVYDDNLNCKIYLSPSEPVPKMMHEKPKLYISNAMTGVEMTCLSIIALIHEISFRLLSGEGG